MKLPLISIIVAVYNGRQTLQQCIDSVAAQTCPNIELIIIDGGSTDGTVDLLKENEKNIAYYISEPDNGIYSAWNKGLKKANGDWVCFLGADDFLWTPRVLEQISPMLTALDKAVCIAYSQIMLIKADGSPLFPVGTEWSKIKTRFQELMCIPHQGVMHRRALFETHGPFDESFHIAGDYEMLLRDLKHNNAEFIPGLILTGMRVGGVSSNPASTLKTMWEIRRAQRMHGRRWPGVVWSMALLRVYVRLLIWKVLGEKLTGHLIDLSRRARGLHAYWTKL